MTKVSIRKVGGSQMIAIPRPLLDKFQLGAGDNIGIEAAGDHIVLRPLKEETTLDGLLAGCDLTEPLETGEEDQVFIDTMPLGAEKL